MHKEGEEVHVSETEASGGSKQGVVRYVLLGGLVLAIVLLSVTWIVPAMMQGDVEEEATVSGEIQSMESDGSSTDSVVGTNPAADNGQDDTQTENQAENQAETQTEAQDPSTPDQD